MNSDLPGFYKMGLEDRLNEIKKIAHLTDEETNSLRTGGINWQTADLMIENVIGTTKMPIGIATYFTINKKDYVIPMAIEEPSVIAAASHAAKLARQGGGFTATSTEPMMIGQIQVIGIDDIRYAEKMVLANANNIKKIANKNDSTLIKLGGGAKGVETKILETERGRMLIVHLLVDVRDAMGANAVNTMCESVAPYIEELTGGKTRLKIISNLAVKRTVKAKAVWKKTVVGADVIDGILDAYAFAKADPYRCATNNKGCMNGIDAVMISTGNDFRAIEAGAHAFAALNGYKPLVKYELKEDDLVGTIELPMAVGIVGGTTKTNPIARIALKILGIKTARELGEIAACVGLANNFAALRAMVTDGIQKGHMKLHAKNIAITAGAKDTDVYVVAQKMAAEGNVSVSRATELLKELQREETEKTGNE
ncbi:MAG: hydroxymethylglutaryl-CoA reductase, degradative [Candidatus Aenigmarchaeota archaeon]|nr:hydroxymethylglutaryl-CoA reductase, degradative [Candidatus Aenigmarchaeota archaeon]